MVLCPCVVVLWCCEELHPPAVGVAVGCGAKLKEVICWCGCVGAWMGGRRGYYYHVDEYD